MGASLELRRGLDPDVVQSRAQQPGLGTPISTGEKAVQDRMCHGESGIKPGPRKGHSLHTRVGKRGQKVPIHSQESSMEGHRPPLA